MIREFINDHSLQFFYNLGPFLGVFIITDHVRGMLFFQFFQSLRGLLPFLASFQGGFAGPAIGGRGAVGWFCLGWL
jgi:hypothetical protein